MYAFELKGEVSELKTLRRHLNIWAQVARLSKSCTLRDFVMLGAVGLLARLLPSDSGAAPEFDRGL